MSVFRNVVFLAAGAGIVAGLFMAVMQLTITAPLIQKAEAFEAAGAQQPGHHGAPVSANTDSPNTAAPTPRAHAAGSHDAGAHQHSAHQHNENAWGPADGFERSAYTVLANVVTAIGFALLLIVASELAGGIANWREGLIWGLAGFAVFTLAPGLGLAPELPAMPAAELVARQAWWVATAAATAIGLALMVFPRHWLLAAAGVVLMVAPHFVGAPQPLDHSSPVPAGLHHQFVVASTITSLVFWIILGAVCGALRNRAMAGDEVAAAPVAG